MRRFASNYLSGRVKVKPPSEATSDRYDYLGLDQAEPNLGTSAPGFALSFTNSDVDTLNNSITFSSNHGLATGDKIIYDGTNADSDVGSVSSGGTYYVIYVNSQSIKLATSKDNATNGQVHALSAAGGAGTHYIGQTTLLTTTPTGLRKLVSLGEDLDLELSNGEYKIKFADGATQAIKSETIADSTLQRTTEEGNSTDQAVSFQNLTDADDVGTGAVSISGGLSVGKTLYMDDQQSITFKGDTDDHSDTTITSFFDPNGFSTRTIFRLGFDDISPNNPIYSVPDGSAGQQEAFGIYQNINHTTGKQISRIFLGSVQGAETITGTDPVHSTPSESHIYSNPVLVLDPNGLGDNTGLVRIKGNLEVLGTQTTIDSTTLEVADLNIVVGKNADTSVTTDTAGIIFGNNVGTPTSPAVDYEWNSNNLPPSIKWYHDATNPYLLANKKIAAAGFIHQDYINDNAAGLGLLRSDGSIDTTGYLTSDNNTLYEINTNDATTQQDSQLLLTAVGGSTQVVELNASGGIGIQTQAATTDQGPGGTATNPIITIDGSGVTPVTYTIDSAIGTNTTISLTASNDQDNPQIVKWSYPNNVKSTMNADDEIEIDLDNTVVLQATECKLTVNRLAPETGQIPSASEIDLSDLAIEAQSATHGAVAYFKRKEIAISGPGGDVVPEGVNGGVITAEVVADAPNGAAWMSFLNTGTGKDGAYPRQGEITTKQAETNFLGQSTKSGIRIWGNTNIDFDVSATESTPQNTTARRLSVTQDGLILRNSSQIIYDGTNYETYVQFTDPDADRTIVFPSKSGTVAMTSDIVVSSGEVLTYDDTSNEDQYIVFVDEGTTGDGSEQQALTNSKIRFNPSTGDLSVDGDVTLTGTLSATTKSFLIDHPTEQDKKLQYASLEGPENGVYIRGKLVNDNVIELPDYWKGLVDDQSITVNLTPIGNYQTLFVDTICDNNITVGGENINCFYTVFAERKDVDKLVVEYGDS